MGNDFIKKDKKAEKKVSREQQQQVQQQAQQQIQQQAQQQVQQQAQQQVQQQAQQPEQDAQRQAEIVSDIQGLEQEVRIDREQWKENEVFQLGELEESDEAYMLANEVQAPINVKKGIAIWNKEQGDEEENEKLEKSEEVLLQTSSLQKICENIDTSYKSGGGSSSYKAVMDSLHKYIDNKVEIPKTEEEALLRKEKGFAVWEAVREYLEDHKSPRLTQKGRKRIEIMQELWEAIEVEDFQNGVIYEQCHLEATQDYLGDEVTYRAVFVEGNMDKQFDALVQFYLQQAAFQMSTHEPQVEMDYSMENAANSLKKIMFPLDLEEAALTREQEYSRKALNQRYLFLLAGKVQKLAEEQRKYERIAKAANDKDKYGDAHEYGCYMAATSQIGMETIALQMIQSSSFSAPFNTEISEMTEVIKKKIPSMKEDFNLINDTVRKDYGTNMPKEVREEREKIIQERGEKVKPFLMDGYNENSFRERKVFNLMGARKNIEDSYKKGGGTESYKAVRNSLNRFMEEYSTGTGSNDLMTNRKNCIALEEAIKQYLDTHMSPRRTDKGKERVEMMQNLQNSMFAIRKDIEVQLLELQKPNEKDYVYDEKTYREAFNSDPEDIMKEFDIYFQYKIQEGLVRMVPSEEGTEITMKKEFDDMNERVETLLAVEAEEVNELGKEEREYKEKMQSIICYRYAACIEQIAREARKWEKQAPGEVNKKEFGCYMASFSEYAKDVSAIRIIQETALSALREPMNELVEKLCDSDPQFKEDLEIFSKVMGDSIETLGKNLSPEIQAKSTEAIEKWKSEMKEFLVERSIAEPMPEIHRNVEN